MGQVRPAPLLKLHNEAMRRVALLLFLTAAPAFTQLEPIQELIEAARSNNVSRLKELLPKGLPLLQGRDGAIVFGQDFLFAVQS